MSVVAASDFLTDEELDDLGEDGLSVVTYMSETEKQSRKKRTSSKPPPSPKSPYLSSANLHSKKASAWRSLRGSGAMHGENPPAREPREFWLASFKSGLALSHPLKADCDLASARMSTSASTPEYLKEAFGMKKPKHSRTSCNGYVPGTPDFKEKEDMYDEILDLKKCLQVQKSENDLMKTKLRRLEEDSGKKDKQIEQLLNPAKSSEYALAFVDKRNDGSAVTNSLKQRILKLEQQCKEKDSALTKLQSDLKTTNMEEMKIALEAYFEEIQRLKVLLVSAETAERSYRAERKESLKQQKALNSALLRLSKNTKQLQEENQYLREELERATKDTSSTTRGYCEWSKQRLVRRIVELEKKMKDSGRARSSRETDVSGGAEASRAGATVTSAEPAVQGVAASPSGSDQEEYARLRELITKLREERARLQATLAERTADVERLSTEKAEATEEVKRLKIFEQEAPRHKEEVERLMGRVTCLEKELEEERRLRAEVELNYQQVLNEASAAESRLQDRLGQTPRGSAPTPPSPPGRHGDARETEHSAARTIQLHWRRFKSKNENQAEFSEEDVVLIQSAMRGHLARQKQLTYFKDQSEGRLQKQGEPTRSGGVQGVQDEDDHAVTLLQAAIRGHLTRCRFMTDSVSSGPESQISAPKIESSIPTPAPRRLTSPPQSYQSPTQGVRNATVSDDEEEIEEDILDVTEMDPDENRTSVDSKPHGAVRQKPSAAQLKLHQPADTDAGKAGDSDDSDDIIVSPSRPARRKDSYF